MATNRREFIVSGMSMGIYSMLHSGFKFGTSAGIPAEKFEKVIEDQKV
ncbi:MAG: hypothetical protein JW723_04885 [Bacteroidales bacterium]|nr:hypothetical protein [Bacteroidales bacterium]